MSTCIHNPGSIMSATLSSALKSCLPKKCKHFSCSPGTCCLSNSSKQTATVLKHTTRNLEEPKGSQTQQYAPKSDIANTD